MKYAVRIFTLLIICALSLQVMSVRGKEQHEKEPWTGKLADGTVITEEDLAKILKEHKSWLETDGKEGQRAYLAGANLSKVDLEKANLTKANLTYANLTEANLSEANLTMADLTDALLTKADLTAADLTEVLLSYDNMSEVRLRRANLTEATLRETNLTKADLMEANLTKAWLSAADLTEAYILQANLTEANLGGANLTKANLERANLTKASLERAKLTDADLRGANLSDANLSETKIDESVKLNDANLDRAKFWNVILSEGVIYEPRSGGLPYIPSMATVWGLTLLTFETSSHGLVELREAFKKAGLRKQEQEITYSIKRTETRHLLRAHDELSKLTGLVRLILFEVTCNYGMNPGRPLWLLLIFIPLFSVPYIIVLQRRGKDGIWIVWPPDRMRKDKGENKPVRLHVNWTRALGFGFYFSVLSAFHIGWRELNVGNWITRMQPQEYILRATGKVRFISGLQSLISVYLLAMSVLSYFGRPFEW